MAAYGSALVARKRSEGGNDLLATVTWATIEDEDGRTGPLSDLELLMFFNLLIAAGSETTRNAIALGLAALIEHPDQWACCRPSPHSCRGRWRRSCAGRAPPSTTGGRPPVTWRSPDSGSGPETR